jgi:glyoxylase I family protein
MARHGWRVVQIFSSGGRPGSGFVNFAVDDLDRHLREVHRRGVETGAPQQAFKDVQLCPVTDPDGNSITLIGNFRLRY